jgi:hypothetical protein
MAAVTGNQGLFITVFIYARPTSFQAIFASTQRIVFILYYIVYNL